MTENTHNHSAPRQQRRHDSQVVRWLRFSLKIVAVLSPKLAAHWLYRLWFRTPRYTEPTRETRWLAQAEQFTVNHDGSLLAAYRWGKGPAVLLVHGWSGRAGQMGAFAAPLVAAGFQVIAFDAPGHGRSADHCTDIFRWTKALYAISAQIGPLRGIVAHSFGVLVTALALRQGLVAKKIVCISSPTDARFLVEQFYRTLHIPQRIQRLFEQRLKHQFGADVWQRIAADNNVRDLDTPALIIHDENDLDIPWYLGKQLADVWPGAKFMLTQGLGHRRVLRDKDVIQKVVDFIR